MPKNFRPNSSAIPTATPGEALAIMAICFGFFILDSIITVAAGFPKNAPDTDASLWSVIAMECIFGCTALVILRSRGYVLSALLPHPNWHGCTTGVVLLIAATLINSAVMQIFSATDHASQPITDIMTNARYSFPAVLLLSLINGVYEETFLLGYLFRAFSNAGAGFALGLSLLVRVLYHLYQGPIGAIGVLVFGLVFSVFYWRTGKLWPVVFGHILADMTALTPKL
jgi:uncharacterized protein